MATKGIRADAVVHSLYQWTNLNVGMTMVMGECCFVLLRDALSEVASALSDLTICGKAPVFENGFLCFHQKVFSP